MFGERLAAVLAGLLLLLVVYTLAATAALGFGASVYLAVQVFAELVTS